MVKKLLLYIGIAIALFLATYNLHKFTINALHIVHPFNLYNVYAFQAIASLILVVSVELLASLTNQYKDQLGFLYLGSMAVKIMMFCVIFRGILFSSVVLSKADSLSLLIPIFIFIFFEVLVIVKILNRSTDN
ncbi:hypothetical protein EAX61_10170 [Dokdonia sinensis]|uniref:Uncharacterized protein n=1 Tax=Dokdonia sinensis TaxID=2479847 RepID=A0A3M0G8L8_9FLAO|nr:DUF6168 family protein [Dokdonia sinensis]RMB57983.1 hypothetical protein EAX61_10170 [Dokdonia sinensis]